MRRWIFLVLEEFIQFSIDLGLPARYSYSCETESLAVGENTFLL